MIFFTLSLKFGDFFEYGRDGRVTKWQKINNKEEPRKTRE